MRRVNVCAIKLKSVYASIVEAVKRGEEGHKRLEPARNAFKTKVAVRIILKSFK